MSKIPYYLSMVTLALVIGLILYIFYYIFVPIEVIRPNVQPYKSITKVVYPGGKYIYEVDACKFINAESSVSRRFVSDVVYTLPAELNNVPKGCKKTRIPVLVPDTLEPGIWHLEIGIQYKINFIRAKSYYFKTEDFEVATPESKRSE